MYDLMQFVVLIATLSGIVLRAAPAPLARTSIPPGTPGLGLRHSGECGGDKSGGAFGDNSGTSAGSENDRAPQPVASQPVAGHGSLVTERGGFEPP